MNNFVITMITSSTSFGLDINTPSLIEEGELVQFEISSPSGPGALWRLRFGDVLPEKPLGTDLGLVIRWPREAWFDSCRGSVQLSLERSFNLEAPTSGVDDWESVQRVTVMVRPSKMTEDEWMAMQADLTVLSVDLANDLIGKASAGLIRAKASRSALAEHAAARRLILRLERALEQIVEQPHAVLRASEERISSAPRRLDGKSIKRLIGRGLNPRMLPTKGAARIVTLRVKPSFDVQEHRQILGSLHAAISSLSEGKKHAEVEISELRDDRAWRMRSTDLPGSSLYERFDQPRIDRLRHLIVESAVLKRQAINMINLPIFRGIQPLEQLRPTLVSRHIPPYRLAWRSIRSWQAAGEMQVEIGEKVRRKDTSRLYEQWVFLQLAAGLKKLGFEPDAHQDVFRRISQRRFLLDLPRGARLTYLGPEGLQLHLYFEPWIRPRETARRIGDALFHGKGHEAAWSPDILLLFESLPNMPLRGIVVDAKYAKRLSDRHWSGVRKYFQIRRFSDGKQAVDQVWLSAPRVAGILLDDDSINWTRYGPDLPQGSGTIQGELGFVPTLGGVPGEPVPLVVEFLEGLLAHGGVTVPVTV